MVKYMSARDRVVQLIVITVRPTIRLFFQENAATLLGRAVWTNRPAWGGHHHLCVAVPLVNQMDAER